jgi:hypothetical protein
VSRPRRTTARKVRPEVLEMAWQARMTHDQIATDAGLTRNTVITARHGRRVSERSAMAIEDAVEREARRLVEVLGELRRC